MTDDKLYTSPSANTFMAILNNPVQQTRLITLSTDNIHLTLKMTSAQVTVETLVTINSSFQTILTRKITLYELIANYCLKAG